MFGGDGNDTLFGGSGILTKNGIRPDELYAGAGDDYVNGKEGDDILAGGAGKDYLVGGEGKDVIYGGDNPNNYYIDQRNTGADGDDKLYGNAGDDQLYAQDGNDTLYGGSGNDILDGGAGNDLVVFEQIPGDYDVILHFNPAEDKIDLTAFTGITSIGQLHIHNGSGEIWEYAANADGILTSHTERGTVIELPNGQLIFLAGVDASTITTDQFIGGASHTAPVVSNGGGGNRANERVNSKGTFQSYNHMIYIIFITIYVRVYMKQDWLFSELATLC